MKQGTSGTYGNESLPNISGNVNIPVYEPWVESVTGAFGKTSVSHVIDDGNDNQHPSLMLSFDASRSSSAYQNDAKVNPDNAEILYCVKY